MSRLTRNYIRETAGHLYTPTGQVNVQVLEDLLGSIYDAISDTITQPNTGVDAFPRYDIHVISGTPRAYDQDFFVLAAQRAGTSIISPWDGWQSGRLRTVRKVCDDVHTGSQMPNGSKIFVYHNAQKIEPTIAFEPTLKAANFLLRTPSYLTGSYVISNTYEVMNLLLGGPTLAGREGWQYVTDYEYDVWVNGGGLGLAINTNAVNPSLDGIYHDDLYVETFVTGDWNRDGLAEAAGEAVTSQGLRDARAACVARLLGLKSTLGIYANLSQMSTPKTTTGISGVYEGGLMEGMLGESWSLENSQGWQGMMTSYQRQVDFCKAPKHVIFMSANMTSNGRDFYRQDRPYQAFRYGLTSCLMGDGYWSQGPIGTQAPTTSPTGGHYNVNNLPQWFDELSVNPVNNTALTYPNVSAGIGWMGQAIDAGIVTTAWKQGLMRRRFRKANGKEVWAIVNPKGNAAQNFTCGQTMQKIVGSQDPVLNDGSTITASQTINIPANEGLILVQP